MLGVERLKYGGGTGRDLLLKMKYIYMATLYRLEQENKINIVVIKCQSIPLRQQSSD